MPAYRTLQSDAVAGCLADAAGRHQYEGLPTAAPGERKHAENCTCLESEGTSPGFIVYNVIVRWSNVIVRRSAGCQVRQAFVML